MATTTRANGDSAKVNEGGSVVIDVLGNDAGAKLSLFSLGVYSGGAPVTSARTAQGALIKIANGRVVYDTTDAATLNALSAGRTLADSFSYTVRASDGTWSSASVSIAVTGTNDRPTVASNTVSATVAEGAGRTGSTAALTSAGSFDFADVDRADTHTVSVSLGSAVGPSGVKVPSATLSALGTGLTASVLRDSTGTGAGTLAWNFSLAEKFADFLAAGETLTLCYAVTVNDGRGGTASKPVTVLITGSNDAPTVTGAGIDRTAAHWQKCVAEASGSVAFADADLGDRHSAAATLAQAESSGAISDALRGALGSAFAVRLCADSTGGKTGDVDWAFDWPSSLNKALLPGQTLLLTYNVSVADGRGGTAAQAVTILVTGTSGEPAVLVGVAARALTEVSGTSGSTALDQAGGTLAFDGFNPKSISAAGASLTFSKLSGGGAIPAATAAALASAVTLAVNKSSSACAAEIGYTFSAADRFFDFLSAGETLTLAYSVKVSQSGCAPSAQLVKVTVTGTNDAPVITSGTFTGSVTEMGVPSGSISTTGALAFADLDLKDVHTVSATAAAGTLGTLTPVKAADTTGTGTGGKVAWTYSVDAAKVEYLDAGQNKVETFTITLSDGKGGVVTRDIAVTIVGTDDKPVARADGFAATEDTPLTVPARGVLANDTSPNGIPLSAVLVTQAEHGTVTLNPDGSFSYVPAANYNGPDSFTYKVNDGRLDSDVVKVSIDVAAVNDAPVAAADSFTIAEDELLSVGAPGFLANDTDVDGDALSAVLVAQARHGIVSIGPDGRLAYIPDENFNGTDTFTYKVNDGKADSAPVTVTITVTPVNDAPVANADGYTVAEDTALLIPADAGVLANDTDVDGDPLKVSLVTGPQHGTLTLNPDGSFEYLANANYNGPDSFSYAADDGRTATAPVTVNIDVTPVNDAPVGQNDSFSARAGETLAISVAELLGNDTDIDSPVLGLANFTQPNGGSLSFDPVDGSLRYTAAVGFAGIDTFTYRASDGSLESNPVTVSILVDGTPQGGGVQGVVVGEAGLNTSAGDLVQGTTGNPSGTVWVGSVPYSFGGDGPSATTPFAWSTTVGASDPEAGDPALSGLTSGGDPVVWSVQPGSDGRTLIGTATGTGPQAGLVVAKLTLTDLAAKTCVFKLLGPIDHPDAGQSGADDAIRLDFRYTVTDADGDTANGTLSVDVRDDAPATKNTVQAGSSAAQADTNLLLVLDLSGSQNEPSGLTNLSRLDVLKASVNELLERYEQAGDVSVRIVTFSSNAVASGATWTGVEQAKAIVASLTASGTTNYHAALATAQNAFDSPGKIAGANNVSYFLSDGQPNVNSGYPSPSITTSEQFGYEQFLGNNAAKSYAIGLGTGLQTTNLDPIAYDGVSRDQIDSIVVTDLAQLTPTLTQTIPAPITGGAIALSGNAFGVAGADQPVAVDSVLVDGKLYGLDDTRAGNVLTLTDKFGATFSIDFDDGLYSYRPLANLSQSTTETVRIGLVDRDGDISAADLTFAVDANATPPIARDDRIITNNAVDSALYVSDSMLLFNDAASGTPSVSLAGGSGATRSGSGFAVTVNNSTSFSYGLTVGNGLADTGTVRVTTVTSTPLGGTGLGDILIGRVASTSTITAFRGDDLLIAGSAADTLDGGLGADSMTGGRGADTFLFSSALGSGNVDHITDYLAAVEAPTHDTIQLSRSVFSVLPTGALASGAFKEIPASGSFSTDADDRIFYFKATGELFYNASGNGNPYSGVHFATIDNSAPLTAADFIVV